MSNISLSWYTQTILDLFHYIPNQPDQTPEAMLGIRRLIGLIPAAIYLTGALIVLFYPIGEKQYREMVESR